LESIEYLDELKDDNEKSSRSQVSNPYITGKKSGQPRQVKKFEIGRRDKTPRKDDLKDAITSIFRNSIVNGLIVNEEENLTEIAQIIDENLENFALKEELILEIENVIVETMD
jgi:hypothetical protein